MNPPDALLGGICLFFHFQICLRVPLTRGGVVWRGADCRPRTFIPVRKAAGIFETDCVFPYSRDSPTMYSELHEDTLVNVACFEKVRYLLLLVFPPAALWCSFSIPETILPE